MFTGEEDFLILSKLPPSSGQKRLALVVVLGLFIIFVFIATGAASNLRVSRVDAFVPIYLTAMFVNDSITAILLFAQFPIARSRAILVIASGYLFTALMLIPYILTFPGVFVADRGLFGGLQTTSWLYVFQFAGFPVFVIVYAMLKDEGPDIGTVQAQASTAIGLSVALTVLIVSALSFFAIAGEPLLPRVHNDAMRQAPLWRYIGATVALTSTAALIVLWFRRRSMLDLSLLLVMYVYAMLIPLSYATPLVRFSVGWYTVRIFAVIASSLVLIFLLYEITTLYVRLLQAVRAQRREREARLITGDAVAASIAHEVNQPLTAMVTSADAGLRFLDRSMPNLDKAKEAFKRIAADGHRAATVIGSIRTSFKKDVGKRAPVDINDLIGETHTLVQQDLAKHRIIVEVELDEQLPQIAGDRTQLQQVLVNLITNAIESMAPAGEPRILSVKSEIRDGREVAVSVADTGPGIGSQHIDQIFNPLFTTKSDGMGMGLSICRSIIEAHNGRLWATPNEPQGAVFCMMLPIGEKSFGKLESSEA